MKIFFDTEFTGLRKNTTLISIGLISEDGKTFYGECTDFDKTQCDDWIIENVVSEMLSTKPEVWKMGIANRQICGTSREVMYNLKDWLQQFDEVQFVSDVCHYDFVLLIDLLTDGGTAFDLPSNVSPCCYDINQDIAFAFGVNEREAFDMSREDIIKDLSEVYGRIEVVVGRKHNSLYDARVIREIYKGVGDE